MTRLLVVDDREENLYLLRVLLEGNGYQVDMVRHGAEALLKARQAPPDLIVSDLLMPVMDGFTLLRQWKADERLKRIPFVVYTATYTDPSDERLALDLGADAFIIKPAEPEEFIARLKEVIKEATATDLVARRGPEIEAEVLLQEYSEILVHKLEDKLMEAEEATRRAQRSEERLRLALDAGGMGMWDWDLVTGEMVWCENHARLFGLQPEEFDGRYETFRRLIHPDDLPELEAEVADARTQHAIFQHEYRIRWPDGSEHWIAGRGRCFNDATGQPVRMCGTVRDITERKRTGNALISANRRLNDIIEFLPDATVVIDTDKKVIAWNRALEEMTGVDKKEIIGKPDSVCTIPFYGESRPYLLDLIDASDKDLESKYGYIERKGNILYAETYLPRVYGGRGAFVFATGAPLFDIHGNRVGAIESIRDITESKKKEEALIESQQQLTNIIDFLPDATLVIDKAGKVIAWNRAIEEMTGIPAADMLGKDNFEYALPFYGERRPILIDLVFRPREEAEAEYVNVEKRENVLSGEAYMPALRDGEAYLFGKASALFDSKGNLVGAIESIRDISERRHVEEALVRAEEKYRSIFENAMEGIYQTTLSGRCISINPAFANILGYDSPEEVLNTITDLSHQLYVKPEHRAELLRLLNQQSMVHNFETQFYRKDGSIAWVTLNIRAVRDKTGQVSYLEGTAEDISDRKVLENRLVQAQKMEAIGALAGGIAHDFNNILAPIIGYSELALREISEDTRLHRNIEQVFRSGCRAKDLVKQILTFSRKTEQEFRPVQVSMLVKETLQMLRSTLPSTIEICQNIDEDAADITVMADPTQIHQVLMNLCTNAAHAMREKGGVLSVALATMDMGSAPGTEIPGLEDGYYLRLSVSDTGHGMDEAIRQRIFEPYFTTKGADEGTGLGLAVVYGIVKSVRGGIAVSSRLGEGASFHVFFPIAETIEVASADIAAPLLTGSGRILVVDDEKYVVEILKEMLEKLGYQVTARYSSTDALGAFQAQHEHFEMVITDQTMPQMTGTELAKEFLKIRPDIPIILCTGFSEMVDEAKARKIGIKAFLMKPVALQQLAQQMQRLLNQE
jgi:PAS domain S-box-containing protein